jgi:hypothetical protein
VRGINQRASSTTTPENGSPEPPRAGSSSLNGGTTTPYFHEVDEKIVTVEKASGCAPSPGPLAPSLHAPLLRFVF